MSRLLAAISLFAVFLGQIVISGFVTAWIILRPGQRPVPGLIRVPFSGIDPTGAAILGGLITLTPGTTTLDIDLTRGELLLHLLDARDPEAIAQEIHTRFERPLRRIFPAPAEGGPR